MSKQRGNYNPFTREREMKDWFFKPIKKEESSMEVKDLTGVADVNVSVESVQPGTVVSVVSYYNNLYNYATFYPPYPPVEPMPAPEPYVSCGGMLFRKSTYDRIKEEISREIYASGVAQLGYQSEELVFTNKRRFKLEVLE